jgi:hypothetical protein
MDRRTFLKRSGTAALGPLWARELWGAAKNLARDAGTADLRNATRVGAGIRRRPSDADWPPRAAWKRLNDEVDGNLIPVEFPIVVCAKDTGRAGCQNLFNNIHNPDYIGDQPGLTQTLGWVEAWVSKPSVYVVAASNADHITAAANFARIRSPGQPQFVLEWARQSQATDKVVYSRTLVGQRSARTRVERQFDPDAVQRLKADAKHDITVDRPELAAQAIRAGLVDEFQVIVCPAVGGGGKRFFPDGVRGGLLVGLHWA